MKKSVKREKPESTNQQASGKSRPRKKPAISQAAPPRNEVAGGQQSAIGNPSPAIWPPLPVDEHPHFHEPRVLRYLDARGTINDCDLLLRRAEACPSSQAIAAGGRSIYSHAAMACWWRGNLMCLEFVEWHGGRAVHFSRLVEAQPGLWDVFETNPERRWRFVPDQAANAMIRLTGLRYGWHNLARASLRHLPIVRLFVAPPLVDEKDDGSPFCSQAVSRACRCGGVDPVPFLADRATEPGDLARSNFFRYRFTLVP